MFLFYGRVRFAGGNHDIASALIRLFRFFFSWAGYDVINSVVIHIHHTLHPAALD